MKKTWIKIKRGLLEPKHRERLGIRIWLYVYILDNADWETGQIREWRDKDAADELDMPWRTLAQQRQKLMDDGYITCEVAGNRQIITIHNYTNPRRYDGEVTNEKGTEDRVQYAESRVPDSKGTYEGTHEGTYKGLRKPRTPSLYSHNTNHNDIKNGGAGIFIFNLVGFKYEDADIKTKKAIEQLIVHYGEEKLCAYAEYLVEGQPEITLPTLLKTIKNGIDLFVPTGVKVEGYY